MFTIGNYFLGERWKDGICSSTQESRGKHQISEAQTFRRIYKAKNNKKKSSVDLESLIHAIKSLIKQITAHQQCILYHVELFFAQYKKPCFWQADFLQLQSLQARHFFLTVEKMAEMVLESGILHTYISTQVTHFGYQ
jgi:hypothetical protein